MWMEMCGIEDTDKKNKIVVEWKVLKLFLIPFLVNWFENFNSTRILILD